MVRVTRFTLFMSVLLLAAVCQPLPLTATIVPQPPTLLLSQTAAVVSPQFLRTACLYRIPPDANVTCGYLLVPEDRSQPTSKTIRLHVLIFKSSSSAPAADPLILLNGGPGSAGQPLVEAMLYDLIGEVWRAERDLIYLDQRGTGFSLPSLYCPESAMPEAMMATMSYTMSLAADTAAMRQCYTRLRDEGINLAAYNLAESAADITDLRLALGYEQVNLYGFSYGSLWIRFI